MDPLGKKRPSDYTEAPSSKVGHLGDTTVESTPNAPTKAKAKESAQASDASNAELQSRKVESAPSTQGLWGSIKAGAKNIWGSVRAEISSATGISTAQRIRLDGIILNKPEDRARAVEIFEHWGREMEVADKIGKTSEHSQQRFLASVLAQAGLIQLDKTDDRLVHGVSHESLMLLQLLSSKIEALQHDPDFIKLLQDNPQARAGFMYMKQALAGPVWQVTVACGVSGYRGHLLQDVLRDGIPTNEILRGVFALRYDGLDKSVKLELNDGQDQATFHADAFTLVKRQLLPFARDEAAVGALLDPLEHLLESRLENRYVAETPWAELWPHLLAEQPMSPTLLLSREAAYPWEELGALADSMEAYATAGDPLAWSVRDVVRQVVHDYFDRAELPAFSAKTGGENPERLSVAFLRHLSLDQLSLILDEDRFNDLKRTILSDWTVHEPFISGDLAQRHLQPMLGEQLLFGKNFVEREYVGMRGDQKIFNTKPSETKLRDFFQEKIDPSDYKELVKVEHASLMEIFQVLRPEDIVELFNRNGVWANYSDEQVEKMLPAGMASDVFRARAERA